MSFSKKVAALVIIGAFVPVAAYAQALPKGAVLSFNLSSCPKGWSPYAPAAGAFAVGVGGSFKLGASGSMDQWVLTSDMLPAFSASTSGMGQWPVGPNLENTQNSVWISTPSVQTCCQGTAHDVGVVGGTKTPKSLPLPKVSGLLFCEKQ